MQFSSVLTINKYYLKKNIYISDIIAFFIVLLGFFVSFFHIASKALNIPIEDTTNINTDKKVNNKDKDNKN
jgi:hypothetical protein